MTRIPRILAALTALALVALLPGAATARSHHARAHFADVNHDGIPDWWERKFHLSLRVNQASRDQDRDGLTNLQEFKARLNPRSADSGGDGIPDGQKDAGTVASFGGGQLTINLLAGGTVAGTVDASTEIECITPGAADQQDTQGDNSGSDTSSPTSAPTARAADDGSGDSSSGSGDQGDQNEQGDGGSNCDTTALTNGATIHEAELSATGAGLHFDKIVVLLPAGTTTTTTTSSTSQGD
jgi:hypothetical protein